MSLMRFFVVCLVATVILLPAATQQPAGKPRAVSSFVESSGSAEDDARLLGAAGFSADGAGVLELFRGRARVETKAGEMDELLKRFLNAAAEDRGRVGAELLAWGPLAAPGLRRLANDLEGAEAQARARKLLVWIDGPQSAALIAAAARTVARRQPAGAAEALLAYLPCADNEDVSAEVVAALKAVAMVDGRPDPALVRALADPMPLRRATAGAVLGQVGPAEREAVAKLLADEHAEVRLVAALGLARANHPAAVPVLIDLLPLLPTQKREQVDAFLQELAGEWAPVGGPLPTDEIALRVRRGAWAAWWTNVDGPALLEVIRKRTPSLEEQEKVKQMIALLGDASFQAREKAVVDLSGQGRIILPLLREALKDRDPEIVYRARQCIRRLEEEPVKRLPQAAVRMLALRRPAAGAETLLAYLPFAEEETLPELHSALAVLALADGKPDPAMLKALSNDRASVRAAAAEALAKSGVSPAMSAARKLLTDAEPTVRMRVAQALAPRDAKAVSALITLMAELPSEQAWQVHEFLSRIAGERAPPGPTEDTMEARKVASAAWAEWWKANASAADLNRFNVTQSAALLGYTVICEYNSGTIVELGRDRKPRWSFGGTIRPIDVWALPNNRVLVAEYDGNRVTERDTKGAIIWQKQTIGFPRSCQRLPNGHTLITCHQPDMIIEVDRNGKDVATISNLPQRSLTGAYKNRNGQVICTDESGTCLRLDGAGKQLSSFNTRPGLVWLDLMPNGHILLSHAGQSRIAEYDAQGKVIFELNVVNVTTATALPNGNFLIACNPTNQVMEIDRKGTVLWEYRSQGPFRARGR